MIYDLFKFAAFKLDPETIHHFSIKGLSHFPLASSLFGNSTLDEKYKVSIGKLDWSFPVGLAAGLDKNGEALEFFSRLPFGAIEVGTVTPKGQAGNSRPRLFRYPEEESLRNRMGFNNEGAEALREKINNFSRSKVLGVNLGKNKTTPEKDAWKDYHFLYKKFCHQADYLVINVSSPNTPGLRSLQSRDKLNEILESLKELRDKKNVPLFLKVSPDLNEADLIDAIELTKKHRLNGIIATNTTIVKDLGPGGVSGKLLKDKSRSSRKLILEHLKEVPNVELIGVGGIDSYADIKEFWELGGKVVQIYTSFIYQGPKILFDIKNQIDKDLSKTGCESLEELISYLRNSSS